MRHFSTSETYLSVVSILSKNKQYPLLKRGIYSETARFLPALNGGDAAFRKWGKLRTPLNRSIDMLFNRSETPRRAILMRERPVDAV